MAALVALRALAGEERARAAAPFLVFTPAAVWMASSLDPLHAGVSAAGIALFALACARAPGDRRTGLLALGAELVLGAALQLSSGVSTLGAVVLVIAVGRRRPAAVGYAAGGVVVVFALFLAARFNWLEGLQATREQYLAGVWRRRPDGGFLVISLAAFAPTVGPAAVTGFARQRDLGAPLLAGGALIALAAAGLSGMSKGETERIWLPLAPWPLVATVALRGSRGWLAGQVALSPAFQLAVRSPW